MPKRVAIVGAGPAGAYTAGQLRASRARPDVDLFDRLPTPWGLLRGGRRARPRARSRRSPTPGSARCSAAAAASSATSRSAATSRTPTWRARYHAVIYAVGARSDKSLGIPGEDLPGSLPATDLVGWYNGHPDYRDLAPDLSVKRAVIIGNGNVAADVARILTRSVDELARTDIADHALEALRESAIEEVVVLGRRGPAQAAFTSAELRELGHMNGVAVTVDSAELDPVSQEWLASEGTFTARRNVRLRAGVRRPRARRPTPAGGSALRFLRSPVAILGDGHVEGVDIARTELYRDDAGAIRARTTDRPETIECGLVLRSVGYRAVPLPDVPFDERAYVMPNERGRVQPGVYCVGWIKRGPTGILGTNKRDAEETVRSAARGHRLAARPAESGDVALPDERRHRRRLVRDRPRRARRRRGAGAPAREAHDVRRAALRL